MLELYYNENSICSERPLMVLAEKGVTDWVPHEVHLFKGEQFDPDYMKLNPKAQVPTLVHDGEVIRESTLICDYLDDLYPDPPLKPQSRADIAHMREWVKDADEAGFEGVASLSFVAVFRAKMLAMPEDARNAQWDSQTVLERTQRQKSCVFDGFDSPYAMRAIAAWERMFAKIEKAIAGGGPWLMGEQFTLADLELGTFIARLDGLTFADEFMADRPNAKAWWERLKARPSYVEGKVGPTGEEIETMGREGRKVIEDFRKTRAAYLEKFPPA